jgi:hypothetical protein
MSYINTAKLVENRRRLQQEISTLTDEQLSERTSRVWWGVNCESWGRDYEGLDAARSELRMLEDEWSKRHPKPKP